MNKNIAKKILTVTLAFIVALGFMVIPKADTVHAETNYYYAKYAKTLKLPFKKGKLDDYSIYLSSRVNGAKKITITSSNKSVFDPQKKLDFNSLIASSSKTGTATVKIKVKKSKTTKTYKMKVKVFKYQNPFKSFKVGKKNAASKFNAATDTAIKNKAKKAKIKIKPKKNWKVKKIVYERYNYSNDKVTKKTVKNGKKITLKANSDKYNESLTVTMYNKKKKSKMKFILTLL